MSTLLEALARSDLRDAERLIDGGVEIALRDPDGRTVLMHAAIQGKDDFVRLFINSGANVDAQDKNGDSALHFAAQGFKLSTAMLLLSSGADVDLIDQHGNTPLWRAVFNSKGRGEMIKILLGHGANREAKNKNGKSPFDLANTIANYDVKRFLRD